MAPKCAGASVLFTAVTFPQPFAAHHRRNSIVREHMRATVLSQKTKTPREGRGVDRRQIMWRLARRCYFASLATR
jgi:hypothetical protein